MKSEELLVQWPEWIKHKWKGSCSHVAHVQGDKPVSPKGNPPAYSPEGLMPKLKLLQYFGHLIQRADSLEKSLMLGKI